MFLKSNSPSFPFKQIEKKFTTLAHTSQIRFVQSCFINRKCTIWNNLEEWDSLSERQNSDFPILKDCQKGTFANAFVRFIKKKKRTSSPTRYLNVSFYLFYTHFVILDLFICLLVLPDSGYDSNKIWSKRDNYTISRQNVK